MKILPGSRLVFIGDSITDCGRGRPVGEGNELGFGYVALVNALLQTRYPGHGIRVFNMGQNGNTVLDIKARWQTDVLALQPDWVCIFIGINDVWRQFDSPLRIETHVPLARYAQKLEQLLSPNRPNLQLVLATPFFLEPHRQDPMRRQMDAYANVVRQLAQRYNATLMDSQAAMDRLLEHQHPMSLCWDRIHPNLTGHMALADAFMQAIDG